jgi:alpha-amylase/alpha-mannosidase (GH57 family)
VTGEIGSEPNAGKYRNWNERITAESYRPNAEIGNFDRISFDMGESLIGWLKRRAPETYHRVVRADRLHHQRKKIGNAIGGPFNHAILPLLKDEDKQTELYWGRAAFRHHFGRDPQGIWLPETALDLSTLQAVEAVGYQYTVIAQGQVTDDVEGSGPYWVDLQNGRQLAVFVRNDDLSNDLSFNISAVGGAGHWARNKLGGRWANKGLLTLVATTGETFGHHHLGEQQFLHWLLDHEAPAIGYTVVTLGEFLRSFPPRDTIEVKPFSSWSCFHGIARWLTGCACTPGHSAWKGALLRALDNLADDLKALYREVVRPLNVDPWQLRKEYIRVQLNEMNGPDFLAAFAPGLTSGLESRILALLDAEMHLAASYTSNAFFGADFESAETRFAIANAVYAAYLAEQATGQTIGAHFRDDLYLVRDVSGEWRGSQIYDSVFEEFLAPKPVEAEDGKPVDDQRVTA